MNCIMSRLSTYLITWITMSLFLDASLMENKKYSDASYWQDKLFHEDNSTEMVGSDSLNKNAYPKTNRVAKYAITNAKRCRNVIQNANRKTLIDYNDPAIMEDPSSKSDQDFADHVRVKRSDAIVHRQNRSTDPLNSSPRNFCDGNNTMNTSNNSIFKFGEPYAGMLYKTSAMDTPHSRRKRGILAKNGERRKRVKGNIGHSRHRVGTQTRNKKHGASKSSGHHRRLRRLPSPFPSPFLSPPESGNTSLDTDIVRVNVTNEKVEIDQKGDTSLTNNRSFDEQRGDNTVVLPFVHTGKAELRIRIEKMPANESSFFNLNNPTNHSGEKTSYLLTPKDEVIDQVLDIDVTNSKPTSDFDASERKEANNYTRRSASEKVNYGDNVSSQEANDFGSAVYHEAESLSNSSVLQGIEDDESLENGRTGNGKDKVSTESMEEDTKSRAKRNQEIMSQNCRSSDTNATRSKRLKNVARKSIRGARHEKTRNRGTRGDRAVRSIEEIKELAEKLIVKVNELQLYVNKHNETSYTTDSCLGKDTGIVAVVEEAPSISLQKQGVSSFRSRIASGDRQHSRDEQVTLTGQGASRVSSNGSRSARGEHRTRRRSRRKWGRWMDWSSCSVTCGKGRQIRWRHCLRDCYDAETEMEEKACQLPACSPGKFLGIF